MEWAKDDGVMHRCSGIQVIHYLWLESKKYKCVVPCPTDVLQIPTGVCLTPVFTCCPHMHTHSHSRRFIPKGTQLKESESLNHFPVPHPCYQPRLMRSPLMKRKKGAGGNPSSGTQREGGTQSEGLTVNAPQVQ